MITRYLAAAVLAAMALSIWGAGVPGVRAQVDPPPCGTCPCTYDRTVEPHEIAVDDKVHVTIDLHCECPEDAQKGIDIFFVVDRTSVMFDSKFMAPTKLALSNFVNAMDFEQGSAGLITYALSDHVASNLTKDRERILYQISVIRRDEETNVRGLQTAFRKATQKLDNDGDPANEKVIMIVAAGSDVDGNNINMPTVTQAARNAGVKVVFLMFPNARFAHYVGSASECHGSPPCPNWTVGPRWAWPVTAADISNVVGNTLSGLLLKAPGLDSYEIYEAMNSGSVYDAASAMPPHTIRPGPQDIYWQYRSPAIPAAGAHIEYDAQMIYSNVTYPVTDISVGRVWLTDGTFCEIPLPNPPITVREAITPTPTVPVTATPTIAITPTVISSPTPTVDPGDTPTPPLPFKVYLPVSVNGVEL